MSLAVDEEIWIERRSRGVTNNLVEPVRLVSLLSKVDGSSRGRCTTKKNADGLARVEWWRDEEERRRSRSRWVVTVERRWKRREVEREERLRDERLNVWAVRLGEKSKGKNPNDVLSYLRFLISATFPLFGIVTISATKLKMVKKSSILLQICHQKARGDHNFFVSSLELLYFIVVPTFSLYIPWYSLTFSMLHLLRNGGSIFFLMILLRFLLRTAAI